MGAALEPGRNHAAPGPSPDEIRATLHHLLQSPDFRIPARRLRLLNYLVDQSLSGDVARINEYAIGLDVFDKSPDFDPKTDAVVRAEMSRLRQNLKSYYAGAGAKDRVRIDLMARGYIPAFQYAGSLPAAPLPVPPLARARKIFWTAALAVLVLAVASAIQIWRHPDVRAGVDSVVVLPFLDLSADHQSQYLADGLTDEITNDLANLRGLRVIARTSAYLFKGGADVREIGKKLNVGAVLEGSVVRQGNQLHIRAQFNRTRDGSHLWSHTYDTTFTDLISVQRNIARSIADDLQLSRSANNRISDVPMGVATNPDAHDLYLRGLDAFHLGTSAGIQKALGLMQAAIAKDPHFAWPWFSLAKILETAGYLNGWTPALAEQVRADLNKALELDPNLAVAHADLAYLNWEYSYDWEAAEREFRLAFALGNRQEPHKLYAMSLADRGRFAESHQQLRIAEELDPLDAELLFFEGGVYAWERKYGEAEKRYQAILNFNPKATAAMAALAYLKTWEKDCKQAGEYASKMREIAPDDYRTGSVRFAVMVCSGEKEQALQLYNHGLSSGHLLPAFERAQGFAYLGDKETALQFLQQAVDRHEFGATGMKQTPYFDSLHGDARFAALERRVGLEP